jgi:putative acetyltransferase
LVFIREATELDLIPEEVSSAWMVQELNPGVIESVSGKIRCARTLDQPKYWRE